MNTLRKSHRFVLWLLVVVIGLSGCNTIHGFGRDVQHVGDKIADAADRR